MTPGTWLEDQIKAKPEGGQQAREYCELSEFDTMPLGEREDVQSRDVVHMST